MEFMKELLLFETQQAASKEVDHTINIINKVYSEWKKMGRRKNAVDLVTTSANKLATLNPTAVQRVHDAARLKLAVILMRCMDTPPWRPVDTKEKIYKKLYPLIKLMENVSPNTETGGKLKEIIMTRLSAAISTQDPAKTKVFVAYEPKIPSSYLRYMFADTLPEKTYRMMALGLPEDFDSLVDMITINHEKGKSKFKNKVEVKD